MAITEANFSISLLPQAPSWIPSLDSIVESTALKMICCIPILGNIPSLFAFTYAWTKSSEFKTKLDISYHPNLKPSESYKVGQLQAETFESIRYKKILSEYSKISLIRNAFYIGLIAAGILSNPPLSLAVTIGATLLSGWFYVRLNRSIQEFETMHAKNLPANTIT